MDDYAIALTIGMSPSVGMEYVPRQFQANVTGFIKRCSSGGHKTFKKGVSYFIAWCIYEQLKGEANNKGAGFYIRTLLNDAERITGTIGQLVELDGLALQTASLLPRLKHGIPEQLVELCEVPNVGAKRAYLLWTNQIKSRQDLLDAGWEKLAEIVGPLIAKKILEAIQMLSGEQLPRIC